MFGSFDVINAGYLSGYLWFSLFSLKTSDDDADPDSAHSSEDENDEEDIGLEIPRYHWFKAAKMLKN